jgi:DNA modification methylase
MVLHGYSEEELKKIADNSVDMVFTSPPYADRRKNTYGGIREEFYLEWFRPIATEIKRVLKPTGSFFLNIKPHSRSGERSLYVFELVIMLKKEIGFFFVDEFCWTKHAFPGKFDGRFKNAFEPIYHFTKSHPSKISFNPLACGTRVRTKILIKTDRIKGEIQKNGSGLDISNRFCLSGRKFARPSNVINVNNIVSESSGNQFHPATFPAKLVEFFVKSFTNNGDVVLDPFAGSGTTGIVCIALNRKYILIEKEQSYIDMINKRIEEMNKIKKVEQLQIF